MSSGPLKVLQYEDCNVRDQERPGDGWHTAGGHPGIVSESLPRRGPPVLSLRSRPDSPRSHDRTRLDLPSAAGRWPCRHACRGAGSAPLRCTRVLAVRAGSAGSAADGPGAMHVRDRPRGSFAGPTAGASSSRSRGCRAPRASRSPTRSSCWRAGRVSPRWTAYRRLCRPPSAKCCGEARHAGRPARHRADHIPSTVRRDGRGRASEATDAASPEARARRPSAASNGSTPIRASTRRATAVRTSRRCVRRSASRRSNLVGHLLRHAARARVPAAHPDARARHRARRRRAARARTRCASTRATWSRR